ncbi:glycoside hydrolase family 97 protein [Fulvivirga sp. M361]|uniref:glycoside hydrolase family 97 protein n=1 Tax=Fulvivirga sp. M361 TaxID=2594266 RepID=UPI001179DBD9|nr:glycoside hydrolase family 97 protein [Fulvivirga sp. M361]TRX55541.1 glycoside hydrolase family 97 protein [Fulvivirga sp. M361]
MKFFNQTILVSLMCWGVACSPSADKLITVESPSGNNLITFFLTDAGEAAYLVAHNNKIVIDTSYLSFEFKGQPTLQQGLITAGQHERTFNEQWEMPWGEQRTVINHYNELKIDLIEEQGLNRQFSIIFKVYDDGIGLRYFFPEQTNLTEVMITDENTQFNLTGDHDVWWIPGDWDIYEYLYNETKLSAVDATSKRNHPNLGQHNYIPENAVNTPVTMKTKNGTYLSFHEANLTDYAGMTLKVDVVKLSLQSELVGSENTDYKVIRTTPFSTPWRTVQIADRAGDLIESNLIVNLNEPNKLGDVSWFKPTKYVGIWWEMHLGKSSWSKADGKHGATTENAKKYIDFAAANDIGAVLVEGWNTGWEHWIGFEDREGVFDFVTPYEDYDLEEVVRYGREKGVELIMHHETSAAPRTYEQQMDTAYSLMQSLGIHAVKTGYVGKIIPKGEYHHGQWMVNHYRKAIEKGAQYQVAINAHEPIKATGIRRTYPNAISREGLRGQEFNAWSVEKGNPPDHLPTVAFTRMLAGPIDFTPGIFNIKLSPYKEEHQVNTTLAHQLALYVVIYSPVQMAADLPESYSGHPAFQFIRDVGVNWEQTRVLDGEVGDFVAIARQERGTRKWFFGAITDEEPRELTISLDFLDDNKNYTATIYSDGDKSHWNDNPTDYKITTADVNNASSLDLKLAAGGGVAISFTEK